MKEKGGEESTPYEAAFAAATKQKQKPSAGEMVPGSRLSDGADGGGGVSRLSLDQEIESMRTRLRELEKLQCEIPPASHEDPSAEATTSEKAEVDARSIYVGNVDYDCSPEEIQQHFQTCGTINRVTILADEFGRPKGFAYVEFLEVEAVQNALLLNETELHDRPLKVCQKRTNIPGMNQSWGWHPHQPFYPFYPTYGRVPRFKRPYRFNPYY